MKLKTSKNTVNIKQLRLIIGIILAIIFGIILIFTVFKNISPIYLPYQEKEKIVEINENNNEAQIHVNISLKQSEDIEIQLYSDKNKLIEPIFAKNSMYNPEKIFAYTYNVGNKKYKVKIKNKTNKIKFFNVKVYANN